MKSLNIIVNRKIKEIEDYERTNPCKEPKMFEASMTITYSQLKTIKADLEVLEILRKHLRFMVENKTSLKIVNNGCGSENCELYKVKQWMESDER
jgi:hypothetical protein